MFTQSLAGAWQFRQIGDDEWLPAAVPGGVHTDLMAIGHIPDPFVGDNERQVAWVAETDWEYRRTFQVAPDVHSEERIFLVCDGLDTLATIVVNGHTLGETNNMFRQYRWEIQKFLRAGDNEIAVRFASPVRYIALREAERSMISVSHGIPGAPYLRKAPCQFGWDWGPQLPPIGIWQEIRLEGRSTARLGELHIRQQHGDTVSISVAAQVEVWQAVPLAVSVKVVDPEGMSLAHTQPVVEGQTSLECAIQNLQLWWPNGYGAQPLYQVTVTLHLAGQPDAEIDRRAYQVGLRTLELSQVEDKWGQSFTFVVNGVPIFAKGSNWIPADSFPTRLTFSQLDYFVRSCAETHQNMLRVWGGGFYEDERFYDLCDRYGVLIWQDFIFSCAIYPLDDPGFVDNVRVEVAENVRRLRHRAALAIWCGNNEMEEGWVYWNWDTPERQDLKAAFEQFFYHTLPGWVGEHDPDRAYWPSSPSCNIPFANPRSNERGDAHYWEVWHGLKPFTAYRTQFPRFMSEFGFQSLPPMETVRTFAAPADWNMTSYIMEQHQKNARGNTLMVAQMLDNFRLPKDFPSLVYMTMVLQADGIRYGVEHWRRHRDRVSGTLYWQTNDCWPVASWSSLDYFGRWKALHYAARRFYAPVLLSIEDDGTRMGIYLTSDLTAPWAGTVRWSLETIDGRQLDGGEASVTAAPLATTPVTLLDFDDRLTAADRRRVVFVAELYYEAERVAQQVATFAPNKHLALVEPGVIASMRPHIAGHAVIEVKALMLARFVELSFEGADAIFSDNYFDVRPSAPMAVTCALPDGWTIDEAKRRLRVRSLFDAFG